MPTGELADHTGPYKLEQPTLDEAHTALKRLYGPHTADVWQTLLHKASLTGRETESWAFDRLVSTMAGADPVIQICAQALAIRSRAYERLRSAAARAKS